jgi:hypothetical protein
MDNVMYLSIIASLTARHALDWPEEPMKTLDRMKCIHAAIKDGWEACERAHEIDKILNAVTLEEVNVL